MTSNPTISSEDHRRISPASAPLGRRRERASNDGVSRALLARAASSALVTFAFLSWMPASCSAFVVPVPAAAGAFCGCSDKEGASVRRCSLRRPLPEGALGATRGGGGGGERDDGARGMQMLWSGGKRTKGNEVTVNIERTSMNSRRISGSIVVNRPIEDVWLTLTDYDRLAEYVPNLTQSKVKPSNDGQIKLWQEGAQKIVGFDFRASVEMFMDEHFGDPENRMAQRKLTFGLLDSRMFTEFDGEWRMQFNSRKQIAGPNGLEFLYTTKLFYMVHIRPKGPVPVLALEWQISNEVPNNLAALKKAAELVTPEYMQMRRTEREEELTQRSLKSAPPPPSPRLPKPVSRYAEVDEAARKASEESAVKVGAEAFVAKGNGSDGYGQPDWDTDETLEAYIAKR